MKVRCAECNKEFEYEHKTKYLGAMITETYVECPHCKEKYIVRLDNNLTRKLERKIRGLKTSLSSNKLTYGLRKTLDKALDDNIEFHKQAMSSLMKGEYSWRYQTK
jgi:DNA-directed RNA polymerase subunit RPC12/RpoP